MEITDASIDEALRPLRPITHAKVRLDGEWASGRYLRTVVDGRPYAILCVDPRVSEVLLDVADGRMLLREIGSTEWTLLSSSLERFLACAEAWRVAVRDADALGDDEALGPLATRLAETMHAIDPAATSDADRSPWLIAAEELGYGM